MTGHTGPASAPDKRVLRTMHRLSLFCALTGLAVLIGGFIVLSTSVFDEMSARAHLVIPGESAAMRDDEFIRSVLPIAGVAGAIHLAGVIAGFVGRRYAEERAELGRCALGVGVNAFFLGCAGIIPAVGLTDSPGSLAVLLAVCGGAVLSACFSLFERFFSSAGAKSVGCRGLADDGWSDACRPGCGGPLRRYGVGRPVLARPDCRGRLLLHVRPGGPRPTCGLDHGNTCASAR